ncbi:hypothetical protein EV356DRAFT_36492 [Viridothelium virens]|uniref:Uncharacterized protein n=1 Tax=Viridothelium virens TaxID=1048519 RepID=A0A6A6GTA4_VIRVR|nr:hypothetical protein EV356DRAFT_36492 [Viridothelium virens]
MERIIEVCEENTWYLNHHDRWLWIWDLVFGAQGSYKNFYLPKDWLKVDSLQKAMLG